LMTALMLAAINGTRYPDGLLSTVIRRVKTDSDEEKKHYIKLNDIRAGIIKACINRKAQKEEIKLAWDEKNLNPAYLCGGLFAVYEKIQQDASGSGQGLNRTIKDAYFASACSRPASVMPKLAMLSQNHLKKVKAKFDEKRVNYYQKQLGILMDGLVDGFPITLSLEDQGRFIVGYYHMNRRLWTAAEKKEDTKNA
ncbi:MAG: type I-C CRISPR-associated protein Cas8c/Csd1, partial [Oscillospiraceae bacterium]|nr:type I-C CRISPR-associated protein Cas8c/Csd1 [Oscillospiraceae bacterium]